MNYCELCGGESTLKEGIHPYCMKYYLHQSNEGLTTKEVALKMANQEDILEIYA